MPARLLNPARLLETPEYATSVNSFLPVLDLTPLLPSHLCKRVGNNAGHGVWSLVCRKDVNPHPQRCSTVNSDICTHHECHFTAGRGHFGLLSAVPRRVHLPQGHASPHKGSDIDQGISADTTGAPAILLEDSRPQAILKLRPPIRLDYSTRNGCQPTEKCIAEKKYFVLMICIGKSRGENIFEIQR